MTQKLPRALVLAGVAASAMMATLPASAQTYNYTAAGVGTTCNPQLGTTGVDTFSTVACTATATVGSTTKGVTLSAWGYTGGTTWKQGNLADFNSSGIGAYTGQGENGSVGAQHAFDNKSTGCAGTYGGSNYTGTLSTGGGAKAINSTSLPTTGTSGCGGSIEAMLVSFSGSFALSSVSIGYGTSADLSVYAWVGSGSPTMTPSSAGGTTAGSASQAVTLGTADSLTGWALIGSKSTDNDFNVGSSIFSSYFLVTTYFGGDAAGGLTALADDTFKIDAFTLTGTSVCTSGTSTYTGTAGSSASVCSSTSTGVPEPASMALVGLGLLGAGFARRQSRTRAG